MSFLTLLAFSTLTFIVGNAASPDSDLLSPSFWVPTGCYNAVLTTSIFTPNDTLKMTTEKCLDSCFSSGINGIPYQYGGVRSGDKCVCGNTLQPGSFALASTECNIACPGNSAETCGGLGLTTSLFELRPGVKAVPVAPSVVGNYQFEGCWTDTPGARALRTYVPTAITVSIPDCINVCSSRGFTLAGAEYSHECYCGNALLGENSITGLDKCNMACEGNPTMLCGGSNAISLYKAIGKTYTSGSAAIPKTYRDWSFTACARDTETRTIPNRLNLNPDKMTVNTCLDACAAGNYTVGALQYGQECWCGNVPLPADTLSDESLCDLGCSSNANQLCGGSLTNQVYYLSNGTTPRV